MMPVGFELMKYGYPFWIFFASFPLLFIGIAKVIVDKIKEKRKIKKASSGTSPV